MTRRNKNLGDWGEIKACGFLERHGFVVLDRNYYTPTGEIDIVARLGDDFYFIEVKTRRAGYLASDLSITELKKMKFVRVVKRYCYKRNIPDDVGIIFAGLIVAVDRIKKSVKFRMFVMRDIKF
ncbi:MAG: hypothetical protein US58_C0012G0063 [Candidatus Magasanikbacteria bacterium GW2011_GWA2_37_8]|uniref:UPF0102 protein US58_C0012G0063 n=1 Tax=Candidatus Magasanikbacteria bacterium GW2011_GWA2_37_8 TaxID=1619036 RepID=A0A0G0JVD3_9BACT|nr:MAG: hypothetical protein US58_C0012G0063 [Candidatus Magasanikbacteria bacterium GW2011_GWA2_37_8]